MFESDPRQKLNFCRALALRVYSAHSVNEYWLSVAEVIHISWNLKYESMSFADWLLSVIAPTLGLKTIPDLLNSNSTHTGTAYAHLAAPHTCGYMVYIRHVGHVREAAKITCDYLARIRQVLTPREVE